MASELGNRLADARQALGWSLREAERRTQINNAHLAQIESGRIARPDVNILWTLSVAYGLDFDELMTLAGHVTPAETAAPVRAAAFRAVGNLTAHEQQEVLNYIAKIREGQGTDD